MSALAEARRRLRENAKQWSAFTAEGHCLVLAPPGSGKTELITARLAQDFVDVIPAPYGAACITYSNAAAGELRRRLSSLGVPRRSNLFVGTVHSFALNEVIRPFAHLFDEPAMAKSPIATKEQRDELFDRAVSAVYREDEQLFGLRSTMDRRRRQVSFLGEDPLYGGERVAEMTRLYEEQLAAAGLIDFDGIVSAAVRLVREHRAVRQVLAARYPKVFVDEYQDLGPGLHALVKSICFDESSGSTLFAVADPNQCIYMFGGADPALLEELTDRCDVTEVSLRLNYRSAGEIISRARALIPEGVDVEGRREGGLVKSHQVDGGVEGQAHAVLPMIAGALEYSRPEEVAVLCLSNKDCVTAATVIEQEYPVFVRREDDYPSSSVTQFLEGAAAWAVAERGTSGVAVRDLLARWRRLLRGAWTKARDAALLGVLLDPEWSFRPAAEFVEAVVALGLASALDANREQREDADALAAMRSSVVSGVSAGLSTADLGDRAVARNRIHVLTMHGSKGLEFDVVFLLGLEFPRLPRYRAQAWERLQQRRTFYVAVTRARYEVHLLYTGWMINRQGRRWDHGPSPYIEEMGLDT